MQTIKATGIQKLVKRPYADTVQKDGKTVESKMKGRFYWICTSELGRFVVEDGSGFIEALDKGELWTVTLNVKDKGAEYITHENTKAVMNYAKTEAVIETIRKSATLSVESVTDDII